MLQTKDDLLHCEPPFASVPFCGILALTERKSPDSGGSPMTFDEILTQIIDLLKRQGRVSYSALKRRFDLNDDYLNDLKDELLFAYPVVDENNRGLVWTGETASGQAVAPQPAQPTPQPVVQAQSSPEVTLHVTASPPPDAER